MDPDHPPGVGNAVVPSSQIRNLRPREAEWLAQGHTASQWGSWDVTQACLGFSHPLTSV